MFNCNCDFANNNSISHISQNIDWDAVKTGHELTPPYVMVPESTGFEPWSPIPCQH